MASTFEFEDMINEGNSCFEGGNFVEGNNNGEFLPGKRVGRADSLGSNEQNTRIGRDLKACP